MIPSRQVARSRGVSHGVALAVSLALALLAGSTVVWLRQPAPGPGAGAPRATRSDSRRDAGAPPAHDEEPRNSMPGTGADREGAALVDVSVDSLARLQGSIPVLAGVSWNEVAAALAAESDTGFNARRPPRALRALALELAGTVRTTATAGPGELTHPIVLTRIVEEVLSMGGDPLSMEQREQVAGLASRGGDEIEQVIEGMDSRPRLASTVAEVEAKLDFIEHLGEALTAGQREALDRLVAAEGAPLSPLALIEAREVDLGADAASFRRGVAAELAREFQIDPVLADALAGKLQGGLVPFFDGSALELSTPRRALMAARAHAQTLEELLRAPGLGQEARERALRAWVVTVPRPAGDRAH